VKRYANIAAETRQALETFAAEVRSGVFPADERTYKIPESELALFESELARGVLAGDASGDWL
jgi:hypothetical protein